MCVHVCVHKFICVYACMYACMYVCMHVSVYALHTILTPQNQYNLLHCYFQLCLSTVGGFICSFCASGQRKDAGNRRPAYGE